MSAGYVYILINPSMNGLLKIGRTLRDCRARARALFTTGIPTPFEVAFEVFSKNHEALEREIHSQLIGFRVNSNREFFHYPLNDAINLLIKLNYESCSFEDSFSAISIFHELKGMYSDWLDTEIADIRIVQDVERVWLETTKEKISIHGLKDQYIHRSDFGFVTDGVDDNEFFLSPRKTVLNNAKKFIDEFCPISIINTTDLFHEDACTEIYKNSDE